MENNLFSIFNKYPDLLFALSDKKDGPMKFSGNPSFDKIILGNRKKFLNKLRISPQSLVSADLAHGDVIQAVSIGETGKTIPKTDGLLTGDKDLFLSITVADCLPVFLYDFKGRIIGLIHGGWRGLSQNILASAIGKLSNDFDSKPENILAGIGPGISQCHYEIKEDLLTKFESFLSDVFVKRDGKMFLDLKNIAQIQLLNLGLKKENIEINPRCTYCLQNKYFSYRRDKPKILETMMAVIGLNNF